jgi:hypothetical protein
MSLDMTAMESSQPPPGLCDGCGMKDMVLMCSDPAATEAMSASDRADVARRHEACSIAERVLDFHGTAVEVRPIHDSSGTGDT